MREINGIPQMGVHFADTHLKKNRWRNVIPPSQPVAIENVSFRDYQAAGFGIKKPRNL